MSRLALFIVTLIILSPFSLDAMEFGLRFNSHGSPVEKRTSLVLGEKPVDFKSELKLKFNIDFYTQPMFGNICSIVTNDGHRVAVVASHQGNDSYTLGLVTDDNLTLLEPVFTLSPLQENIIELTLKKLRGGG